MAKYLIEKNDKETIIRVYVNNDGKADFTQAYLAPYTEPGLDAIHKEAYDKAFEDAEQVAESGKRAMYQKGLSDAWEAARKICTNWVLPDSVLSEIFGMDKTIDDIMKESTASEAIEKIRQYEQRQEDDHDREKVVALADDIGIHKLYALVREIRGE